MADYDDDDGDDFGPLEFGDQEEGFGPTDPGELAPMLAAAFRVYHGGRSEPIGLLGQLLDIARSTPEGQAGRPADAVGVSGTTWNRWLLRARGYTDRQGRPLGTMPSARNRERIAAAVRRARVADVDAPTMATVTAVIVWARRYVNKTAKRTTTFDDLDLDAAQAAWADHDDLGAAVAFLAALEDRYGNPVDLEGIETLDLD